MCSAIEMDGANISVVLQGAVDAEICTQIVKSVRLYLPRAEIVLSTWDGTDVGAMDYDVLVMNEDPGALKSLYRGSKEYVNNNINRQIVSTRNGIRRASREYVMKLRSDSVVTGLGFMEYARKYLSDERYLCFEPRNPWGIFKGEYCLCDFWFLGKKDTLLALWDIPLYVQGNDVYAPLAEEYLVMCSYEEGYGEQDEETRYIVLLREKAVIIPAQKSGIKSLKYPRLNWFGDVCIRHSVISHEDWKDINGIASLKDHAIIRIQYACGVAVMKIKEIV